MKQDYTFPEVRQIAIHMVSEIKQHVSPHGATVVGLSGDLGTGKTLLVQHIADILGCSDGVCSPTFSIMNFHSVSDDVFEHLIHIDAYRLTSDKELESLLWHDYVKQEKTLICIEWPERVHGLLPTGTLGYVLTHTDTGRHIETLQDPLLFFARDHE